MLMSLLRMRAHSCGSFCKWSPNKKDKKTGHCSLIIGRALDKWLNKRNYLGNPEGNHLTIFRYPYNSSAISLLYLPLVWNTPSSKPLERVLTSIPNWLDLYLQQNNFEWCYETLERDKSLSLFSNSVGCKYAKNLLDILVAFNGFLLRKQRPDLTWRVSIVVLHCLSLRPWENL